MHSTSKKKGCVLDDTSRQVGRSESWAVLPTHNFGLLSLSSKRQGVLTHMTWYCVPDGLDGPIGLGVTEGAQHTQSETKQIKF